jgi:predicted nucleotidyltransferase
VVDEIVQVMVERIARQFRPLRIVLFGSRARGQAKAGSDVDLLVVLPEAMNKRQAAVEIRRVLGDLPVAKDIVVTTPEEIASRGHIVGGVLRAALLEGTVVYERS